MRRNCILILLVLPLFAIPAYSAEKMSIAILDLRAEGVSEETARRATDLLRADFMSIDTFAVVEKERVDAAMRERGLQKNGCAGSVCALRVGELLSVKRVLFGDVRRRGDGVLITVVVVNVERAVAELAPMELVHAGDTVDEAIESIKGEVVELVSEEREAELLAERRRPAVQRETQFAVERERAMTGYYLRGIVPGWGQYYGGYRMKGYAFFGAFVLAGAFMGYAIYDFNAKRGEYEDMRSGTVSEFEDKHDAAGDAATVGKISVGIFAAVYIAHWVDMLFFTRPSLGRDMSAVPELNRDNFSFSIYGMRSFSPPFEERCQVSFGTRF